MQQRYADIAFPTAVRRLFTYEVPAKMEVQAGMRVWVPLRSEKVIGMVTRVHRQKPDFRTKRVLRVLDERPVLEDTVLRLTEWIHRFYYCSWGEVIQAALPVGLNFVSEKQLKVKRGFKGSLEEKEWEMLKEIEAGELTLDEARKRWKDGSDAKRLKSLLKKECLEIWEFPKQKVDYKTAKHWNWTEDLNQEEVDELLAGLDENENPKWIRTLKTLLGINLPATHQSLLATEGISDYTLRRIEKEGLIVALDLPVKTNSYSHEVFEPEAIKSLTDEQHRVSIKIRDSLDQNKFDSFLLYGVTGSGKTEIYIHALKHALEQGKGGMILVPEIALTPQTVRRFFQIFGDRIAVLHSRLNERERYEAWNGLRSGEKQVVIGPRSAVFAPVKNLGMIVVDEEHDSSYKQFDPAPRYHARDVAIMRANIENAVVVMGSATPSMVTLHGVRKKKHTLLQLTSRPESGMGMPEVKVLDLKHYRSAMRGPLTVGLYEAIQEALEKEEQIILLYNRRGYASYLQCEDCGHIPQSPDCSVSLTYHKKKNMLLCHYSGYARKADTHCENCGSGSMEAKGSGTQQVEDEISGLFPGAKILRMDRDTTSGKHAHREIYETFLNGKADILIGTQLVSKGLDFPNVTVVGVLSAETELAFPSYRSGERMYQLLSQVAGRAGRGTKAGFVYVQTWKPDHRAIRYAQEHDFWNFSREELAQRETLMYPPFSRMIVFQFKGASWSKTQMVAEAFCDVMRMETSEHAVLGPTPALIEWMYGLYQWEAHIKIRTEHPAKAIEKLLDRIFNRFDREKPKGSGSVRINVNVDSIE
ncbi:MAG: primosomal protein N' [Balneolaceae bacterium]